MTTLVLSACRQDGAAGAPPSSSASGRSTASEPTSSPGDDASTPAPPAARGPCAGLAPHACAQTSGCVLDQVTYRELVCRAAEDRCESAVRHADLIGRDADPKLPEGATAAAVARCDATPGCAATSGACSCPCYLLGQCDCGCGGHFLPRCAFASEKERLEGLPPAAGFPSPAGAWGDALVAVRRAPRDRPFRVDPLPDPQPLVGLTRHAIASALGTPTRCIGAARPSAPCEADDQAFYSAYHLPSGALGGGPELLLTFDAANVCTRALVRHTR